MLSLHPFKDIWFQNLEIEMKLFAITYIKIVHIKKFKMHTFSQKFREINIFTKELIWQKIFVRVKF